jgi:GxxExxY protein
MINTRFRFFMVVFFRMDNILYARESYVIIGKAMKVHSILKKGFKEVVYKDALELEFKEDGIPYEREKCFNICYEGKILKHSFQSDFFVFGSIIVEIKASRELPYDDFNQTHNYLRAAGVNLGLLINFGKNSLEYKRIICTVYNSR